MARQVKHRRGPEPNDWATLGWMLFVIFMAASVFYIGGH
jgi:hypothetical protein